MAMKETADAEKALNHLNPDGEEDLLCSKTEHHPKKPMKLNLIPSEDQNKAEPGHSFKSKPGSVLPVRKKLVKMMMFHQIVQCFCSVSDDTSNSPSASAGASETTTSSNANNKEVISNHVYPV